MRATALLALAACSVLWPGIASAQCGRNPDFPARNRVMILINAVSTIAPAPFAPHWLRLASILVASHGSLIGSEPANIEARKRNPAYGTRQGPNDRPKGRRFASLET